MEFEWDENKRLTNITKHGLDFLDAPLLFDAPHIVEKSSYEAEERWLAVGVIHGTVVCLVYTWRGDVIRIISMRMARDEERRKYHAI